MSVLDNKNASILDKLDELTGIVFDGNQFLYRTYHILKSRSEGDLTPGFIAYSFASQIRFAIKTINATNPVCFIVWDGPSSRNSRLGLFPAYKGNRTKSPDILNQARRMMMTEFNHICPRLSLEYPDIEADDVMGIMVDVFQEICAKWVICTRDEDLVQCVNEKVSYYNPYTKTLSNLADMEEKYGFTMDRIPIYKALQGDSADNWPGVSGVGEKTVAKWFSTPGSTMDLIADIYENKLTVKKNKKKDEAQAAKETADRKKQFLTGLQICKIPILDNVTEVKNYLIDKMVVPSSGDWSRFHEVFEINDTSKATFPIGKL